MPSSSPSKAKEQTEKKCSDESYVSVVEDSARQDGPNDEMSLQAQTVLGYPGSRFIAHLCCETLVHCVKVCCGVGVKKS